MDFKIGYSVKPKQINENGIVIFEEYQFLDGRYQLVEVTPTADECIAYDFKYGNSQCFFLSDELNLIEDTNLHTGNNINQGHYSVISGYNNYLDYGVKATILSGNKGLANYSNSQVLGGNNDTDILGERQAVQVIAAAATTDATPTISYLNNDGATMIKVPENTIISFSADVVVVRTGGVGSGNKGDFRKWHEEGAVVNLGGTLTIQRVKTLKVSSGTVSGWSIEAKTTGEYLYLEVVGRNNRDLKWAIQWNLTEIKTGEDLST
tara:strand:- start:5573 stop:6364 length:792 start_codon:yes stop_codon:yes gene_type:complete